MDISMKKTLLLQNLDCAHCAAKIEEATARLDGVQNVSVSFLTTKMVLELSEDFQGDIVASVQKITKKYEPDVRVKEL